MSAYSDKFVRIGPQRSNGAVTGWTKDWLMRLNEGKCKLMHLGKNNVKTDLEIEDWSTGERALWDKWISQKDQWIFIRADLKWWDHVIANTVLGMLKKTFVSRDSEIWKKLYVSLVRIDSKLVWIPFKIAASIALRSSDRSSVVAYLLLLLLIYIFYSVIFGLILAI